MKSVLLTGVPKEILKRPATGVLQNILVNLQSEKLVLVLPAYTVNTLIYC